MVQPQATVAEGPQFNVAQQVGPNAADNGVLLEAVDQVERDTGHKPGRVPAEVGNSSG